MSVTTPTKSTTLERPKRSSRLMLALVMLLILAGVIALILLAQGESSQSLAELRIRDDRVTVKADGGAKFASAVEGQGLTIGDTVKTNKKGQAQVDYFDGSFTRLDSATSFVLHDLRRGPKARAIVLKLNRGRTWNRVEKLATTGDRFELRTQNAVATVRGTTFLSQRDPETGVEFHLGVDGETELTAHGETFTLGPDDCVRVDGDGVRRCTDEEKENLKGVWYDEQAWYDGLAMTESTPTPAETTTPAPVSRPRPRLSSGGGSSDQTTPAPDPTRRPRHPSIKDHDDDVESQEDEEEPTREPGEAPEPPPQEEDPCDTDPSGPGCGGEAGGGGEGA